MSSTSDDCLPEEELPGFDNASGTGGMEYSAADRCIRGNGVVIRFSGPWAQECKEALIDLQVDLEAAMRQAMETGNLSKVDAAVIYLFFFRGLTVDEIATDLGERGLTLSTGQVRRHLRRGLETIGDTGLLEGY